MQLNDLATFRRKIEVSGVAVNALDKAKPAGGDRRAKKF
jgi:hypothetical protein